jgi:PhnB protein
MTTQVTPYLFFNGNCKEAMTFYQQCLGGSLTLMTAAETPMADQLSADQKDMIMHSNLMREGILLLMASDDIMGGTKEGSRIVLSMNFNSESDLNTAFEKLSEGGNVFHPVTKEFWGALFGQFTDKFGIQWMMSYDENYAS